MISRNSACDCGSGKKFKRCCGLEVNGKSKGVSVLSKINTEDFIQIIASLTLFPENHGKNLRLENISRSALSYKNSNNRRISISELKVLLKSNYSFDPMEDPAINLFTELVNFYGGDYIIFPGITESSAFILNNLLSAIYNWPYNSLNEKFKRNCLHFIYLILSLSDLIAKRLGFKRYLDGKSLNPSIVVPESNMLNTYKNAVFISVEVMEGLLSAHSISNNVLNYFLVDTNDPKIKDKNIGDSPLLIKPLLKVKKGYIVASPSSLTFALIEIIKEQANFFHCSDALHDAYHALVWNNVKLFLPSLGFKRVDIADEVISSPGNVKIELGKFDDDKVALLQYIPYSQPSRIVSNDLLTQQRENIFLDIMSLPGFENFQFLDITIPSPLNTEMYFMIQGNKISKTLSISIFDFDILCNDKKTKAIDLWKFSIARDTQLPRFAKMAPLTFLDTYKIYKDHQDSFYLSDEGFDVSKWKYGCSQDYIQQVKLLNDEHSVFIKHNGKIGTQTVRRKDKYAPIYYSPPDLAAKELQFEIEGFHSSIWVKPDIIDSASTNLKHIYMELTNTICYWLWQVCEDVKNHMAKINSSVVQFSFKLVDPEKFEDLDQGFYRDESVQDKINVSSLEDTIFIFIPSELMPYFYGTDNEGDRILVKCLLLGINDLLSNNKLQILSDNQMIDIVERNAPLGFKKKLILLHTRSNPLLDPQYLNSVRYVQDYDVNVVLNSIKSLLGKTCPPEGEIVDVEQKRLLTKNIVLQALLPKLKKEISQFQNEELLQRLIDLNESLIRRREDLRLKTPTRIACFVTQDEHINDIKDTLGDVNRTSIAVRCLLEHIAAEPTKGEKKVSLAAVDELIAIMDQIISWGSLGDQIRYHLFDIRMGILPSGRVGTQKDLSNNIFDPYYESKTKEHVHDAYNAFNQEFIYKANYQNEEYVNPLLNSLNKAFKEEFNVTFSQISELLELISGLGFQQQHAYATITKENLWIRIRKLSESFTREDFNNGIDFLSISGRGDVMNIPNGFDGFDISPWRFNRRLSLLRKPLISLVFEDASNPTYYFGPRQTLVSKSILFEQCITDRLKVNDKGPVKKVLSKLTNQIGAAHVKSILNNLDLKKALIDSEVKIAPNGKLKHIKDIGDIDVLIIDLDGGLIFSLECKRFAPSRNIKEMIEECDKLIGSVNKKGLIKKHEERHEWLLTNNSELTRVYQHDFTGFEVKSVFVTKEDMLFPYLKSINTFIPFLTAYDIENTGYSSLLNL